MVPGIVLGFLIQEIGSHQFAFPSIVSWTLPLIVLIVSKRWSLGLAIGLTWFSIAQSFSNIPHNIVVVGVWESSRSHILSSIHSFIEGNVDGSIKLLYHSFFDLGFNYSFSEMISASKEMGIYHILVISGLHIGVLFRFFQSVFYVPICLINSIIPIPHRALNQLFLTIGLLALALVLGFSWLVDFNPPCQRALLFLFWGSVFPKLALVKMPAKTMIQAAALSQLLLFPNSFASISNFISWAITLLLLSPSQYKLKGLFHQVWILAFTSVIFGQVSYFSLMINFACGRLFNFLISSLVVVLLCFLVGWNWFGNFILYLQEWIWSGLLLLNQSLPNLFFSGTSKTTVVCLSLVLVVILLGDWFIQQDKEIEIEVSQSSHYR